MANNTVNSSVIGVNLQGNSDGATANFALGSHVLGNANSEWVYVCAGLAITTGMIVSLSATFTAIPANSTGAITAPAPQLAFAQGAFAAADFGWVAIRGDNLVVALSSTSSMAAALYIGQSGSIATVPATATLAGIQLLSASATGVLNPATTANITWPRLNAGATLGA